MSLLFRSNTPSTRLALAILCLALITLFAPLANADTGEMRAELDVAHTRLIQVLEEHGTVIGEMPDADTIEEMHVYIANLPDDQVAETLADVVRAITDIENEIERLKTASPEESDAADSELAQLHDQFYDIYSTCSNTFFKNKKVKQLFKNSPCDEYEEKIDLWVYGADSEEEKVDLYQDGIANLSKITKQVTGKGAEELVKIYEKMKSFNESHTSLSALVVERESLEKRLSAIVENLDGYQSKADNYSDDASLNCRAEQVDFDCGNRCERRVRDPILGTYRNKPDMDCLNSCNFQEKRAIADVNEQIDDCIDERDWARDKLEDIESDYNAERSRGMALSSQFEQVKDQVKMLYGRNKNLNMEIGQFLEQLHPQVFGMMGDEFQHYRMNAVSYWDE
ncbi:hypothetical protein [Zhongshania aliphaticivorans]|nr:hypothetical protein [Zhongshania aliphaticivorans]